MAMTMEQLRQPLRFELDLRDGLVQKPLRMQLMKGDKQANKIILTLKNSGEAVDLTGVSVTGSFVRPGDGAEVPLTGEASGSEASVVLADECYTADGQFELSVKFTIGETERTVLAITGEVLKKGSGAVIDVGNVIPSIDDIIAQYATMQQVTQDAQDAASAANAAAEHAPYIGANENWYIWNAESGAYVDSGVSAKGKKGDKGDPGQNGTGSGTVTGVTVNGTTYEPDASGVVNLGDLGGGSGETGEDGGYYTPAVDDSGNLTWTASDADMPEIPGANIKGPQGEAGYTPVRGTDYWTEADKAQIVTDVLAALPNASGVSF